MKKIIALLLLFMIIAAVLPFFLPKEIHQEVEYVFEAEPEDVYDYFYNLKKMSQWFSWGNTPDEEKYSSPSGGVDAYYSWTYTGGLSEEKGKVSITDAKNLQFVGYNLRLNDMKNNSSEAIFQALDDGNTKVIWTFDSEESKYPYQIYNYLMRGVVGENMRDAMVKLDTILQQNIASGSNDLSNTIRVVDEPSHQLFGVMQRVEMSDSEEIKLAEEETWGFVESYLVDTQMIPLEDIGKNVIYWVEKEKQGSFIAGFFVPKKIPNKDEMSLTQIPKVKTLQLTVKKGIAEVNDAYASIKKYAEENNYQLLPNSWELYDGNKATIVVPVAD